MKTLPKELFDFEAYLNRQERQLVLIYLGSPTCGFCTDPAYRSLIIEAKERLAQLVARPVSFLTIGVSVDNYVKAGLAFLEQVGDWDEVVVGNGWFLLM